MANGIDRRLTDNSELAGCLRAFDWSQTPLGPLDSWPAHLVDAVKEALTIRGGRQPAAVETALGDSVAPPRVEGEARFRSLISLITDVPWTTDAIGAFVEPQPAWAAYTGQSWEELRGFGWCNALHPDDREGVKRLWAEACAARSKYASHGRLWHAPSQSWRHFQARATPIFNADGSVREWVGTCTDVEEQKRAEDALRQSERRFRQVTESLPQLVWTCEADGPCDYLSPQWVEYTGIAAAPQLGYRWLEQVHPDDRDRVIRAWEETAAKGADFAIEFRIRRHDGVYRWFRTLAVPLRTEDGRIVKWFGSNTDIDNLKQAEAALRQSEERLRLATSAGRVGVWDWDIVQNKVTWSESLYKIHEMPSGSFGGTVEAFATLVHPDDRDAVNEAITRSIRDGQPYDIEFRAMRPSGEVFWIYTHAEVIRDEAGRPVRMLGGTVDITNRKDTELALREREERYALVLAGAEAAIWDWDVPNKRVVYSPRWLELRGLTGQQISDSEDEWTSRIHPDELPRVLAAVQAHFDGQTRVFSEEYRVLHAAGHWIWVLDRGIARRDAEGRIVRMAGSETDITERKLAEQELRHRSDRLRLLSEAAGVLLAADEPEAMLEALFTKVTHNLGLDCYFNFLVENSGDALRLASCTGVPEEAIQTVRRLEFGQGICGAVAKSGHPIIATFIQQSDDSAVQLLKSIGLRGYACHPLKIGDRLVGTLSFGTRHRDLFDTDEIAFFETLCYYVAVAYERLRLVNSLREADQRKDEFLATLAHELRNPLAPIRTGLEVIKLAKNDPATVEEIRLTMERQTKQLITLVDDLLDVSRITRGKLELKKCRVKLSDVIQTAIEASTPFIDEFGHQLSVHGIQQPLYLDADPHRLAQVLSNLLNNAAKYTPERGQIVLSVISEGSDVVISVRDTGIGVPDDMLERIFEMFAQVERPLERSYTGLGIGLTLVKSIVEMHKGTVEVQSAGENCGSEFRVRLPLASEHVREPSFSDAPQYRIASRRRRVLVVDDNHAAAETLSMVVRMLGNEVCTAGDGQEAIDMAAEFHPDVILMDIGMPKMNGYLAAQHIRQQPWGKKVLLVALTGWGQDEDKRRTREAGFDYHLVKPAEPAELQRLFAQSAGDSAPASTSPLLPSSI